MGNEPPEITQLQPLTPPALERLVKVCLAKDPDGRLQNAHDVVQELRWLRDAAGQPLSTSGKVLRPRRVWPGIVLGALGGALIAATVLELRTASLPPPGSVLRFAIDVPVSRQVAALAFSPDGAQLVYVGTEGGQRALFLHSRDQFGETRIPGTEGATWSFFSPDGSWIAFFAGGRLNRVRADGTDLSTIRRVGGNAIASQEGYNSTGTWAEDGTIILSSDTAALSRLSAPGAEPVPVTRLESDKGELAHAWPHVLPDHKTILFSILTGMTFDAVPAAAVSFPMRQTRQARAPSRSSRSRGREISPTSCAARSRRAPGSGPAGGKRLQLSVDGGREPLWAPDGRQVFYRAGDQLTLRTLTPRPTGTPARPSRPMASTSTSFARPRNRRCQPGSTSWSTGSRS